MDKVKREIDTVGSSTVVSDLTGPIVDHPVASASTAGALLTLGTIGAIHRDFAWQRRSLNTIRNDQRNVGIGHDLLIGFSIPLPPNTLGSRLGEKRSELHPALRNRSRVHAGEGPSLANTYRRAAGALGGMR